MIANQFQKRSVRNIEFSFGVNKTQRSILKYLKKWLPSFLKEIDSQFQCTAKEDDVSEQLMKFLQKRMKKTDLLINLDRSWGSDFQFTTDMMGLGEKPIFLMEAKRLPPTSTHDYVHHHNKSGGISRFKLERPGFGKHLTSSAMIGYVQKKGFDHWFEKVNTWVSSLIEESSQGSELHWSKDDMLIEVEKNQMIVEYTSTHVRVSEEPICLTHFWLNMALPTK